MGSLRNAPTTFAFFRLLPRCLSRPPPPPPPPRLLLLLLLLLLSLELRVSRGFVVPASSLKKPGVDAPGVTAVGDIIRPPPFAATSTFPTVLTAASGAEAEATHDPHLMSLEFQEFVERRKSGTRRVLLDLRPGADFRREHLEGSTSIPIDELEPRLLELPPPFAQPITVVGKPEDLRTASEFLTKKGWQIGAAIGPDLRVATCGNDPAKAWPTESGSTSLQVWRANDFLEFCMDRFLLPSVSAHDAKAPPAGGLVLDLGCGSGRDTVYMAQRLPPGTRVVGVDNHSYALERGARLAEQWLENTSSPEVVGGGGRDREEGTMQSLRESQSDGLVGRANRPSRAAGHGDGGSVREGSPDVRKRACEWLLADLRKDGSLDGLRASVVHGHRFKCERLLPLLRDHVLLPGGYFIWSTFLDTGMENLVPPWRPSRMMRPGELADIFAGDEFEILVDGHGELPTRGSAVPATFFACRKQTAAP